MVAYAFNAQLYQPQYGGSGGLPVGPNGEPVRYKVVISDTEQKPTKDGQGGFLALSLKCIEGPFTGVIQQDNLNLHNKSQQAVEIANKQLSAYCHVTGQFVIADTAQLHNIPFIIEVRRQKNNPEYTEVGAIFDINGNEPGKAGAGPSVAQAPQPPAQQPPAAGVAPASAPAWQQPPAQPGWQAPAAPAPGQPATAPAAWGGSQPAAAPAPAWGQPR